MNGPEPLWKVMYLAASNAPQGRDDWSHCVRNASAAELRAVAAWIRGRHSLEPDSPTYIGASLVVAELLAEADRAEESNG